MGNIAAREIVGLKRIAQNIDAGFDRGDAVIDDQPHRDLAQTHAEHFQESDGGVRHPGAKPEAKESKNQNAGNEAKECEDRDADKIKGLHADEVSEGDCARKVYSRW